jgi:hypothetical protein
VPQNGGDCFFQLDLKTSGDGFFGLASKSVATIFFQFDLKTGGISSFRLGLKTDSCGLVI